MNVQNGSVVWKALADPKRRRIVQLLQAQPLTTGDLCQHFEVSRYAVMKHLKVLEEAGLVETERRGRQRWNFLNASRLSDTIIADTPPAFAPLLNDTAVPYGENDPLTRLTYTLTLEAEITAVFEALTQRIDDWWTLRQWPHSEVRLECFPGGRLVECLHHTPGNNGKNGLLYGLITLWYAPRAFKIQGSFGADDVDCTVHVQLRPLDQQCQLHLTQQFWRPPTQVSLAVFQQSWADMLEDNLGSLVA